MQVKVEGDKFITDIYKKESSRCQYLLTSSCHPKHQTKSIIYSLAYRLKRICSDESKFELRLSELKKDLISRQYNAKVIDQEFDKARKITRKEALKKVEKKKNDQNVLVVEYHPGLPSISSILTKHWEVLTTNRNMKRCFPKKSMVAYKRPKIIKEHLIRAKVCTKRKSGRLKNGYKACQEGCKNCWISETTTTHTCQLTGKTWKISSPINCKTKRVIYKLTCSRNTKKCRKFLYLGKTSRQLRTRINEHRGTITRKQVNKPAGGHFSTGHGKKPEAYLRVTGIERVKGNEFVLNRRESLWINRYDAIKFGANTRD